jgi:prepilin-type N-terminal cleavage/methylation domain-containing protein
MYKKYAVRQIAYAILRPMKVGRKQRGFTIVETMIVLAVSGGLFLVAAIAVSGKQARQEFDQSIQDVRSQIQQVVNDVATGAFPNMNNMSCSVGANGPVFSSTAAGQGENTGCIAMGKVIQFGVGSNPESMRVYTVAGLQKTSSGADVSSPGEAKPKVIAPSTTTPGVPDLTDQRNLLYGLTTNAMTDQRSGSAIGAIAILSSLAQYGDAGIVSGSQQLTAYPIIGTVRGATAQTGAEAINNNLSTLTPASALTDKGVTICFPSAGTNQSGLITIGGGNRQLSVTLQIKAGRNC